MDQPAPPPAMFDPAKDGWTIVENSGLDELIGPVWSRQEGDFIAYGFTAKPRHRNRHGAVHGGVLMTFADHCVGRAGSQQLGVKPGVTVQFNAMFVAPARIGDFIEARSRIVRRATSLLFMHGELTVRGEAVLSIEGVWKAVASGELPA